MSDLNNQSVIGTLTQSFQAVRSFAKNEHLLSILVKKQVELLPIVRKNNPELSRDEAIVLSLLNAAYILKNQSDSENIVLARIRKAKKNPQLDWLKVHRNYVLELRVQGASLRQLEDAIYYRFHHKISHTQISKFLKMELNYD